MGVYFYAGDDCLTLKHPSFPEHADGDNLFLETSACDVLKSVICEQQLYLSGLYTICKLPFRQEDI